MGGPDVLGVAELAARKITNGATNPGDFAGFAELLTVVAVTCLRVHRERVHW